MANALIQIGYVVRAHGVRGTVRVRASENLESVKKIWVAGVPHKVRRVQPERSEYLVELDGVSDRDQAEALKGSTLEVERASLPPPSPDEVYMSDIIGCHVFDLSGRELGVVKETFHSGAHEVLVVDAAGREFMLPFLEPLVTNVDVSAKKIVCDPPEGLVNLDEPSEQNK